MQQETNLPHHFLWRVGGDLIHDLILVLEVNVAQSGCFHKVIKHCLPQCSTSPSPQPPCLLDALTSLTQQHPKSCPVGLELRGQEAWETALEKRLLSAQDCGELRLRCLMVCKVLQFWLIFTLWGCQNHVFVLFLTFFFFFRGNWLILMPLTCFPAIKLHSSWNRKIKLKKGQPAPGSLFVLQMSV